MRALILICVLLAVIAFAWTRRQTGSAPHQGRQGSDVEIVKQPVNFANRTFDPEMPPADMPPLSGGENAECEADFMSNASVRAQIFRKDPAHATLTVTQVRMTLQLNVTIWVPTNVTQRVVDHEEGHREIAEYYYQHADTVAQRIAATYIGRQSEISGADLNAESNQVLQQMAMEITDEYDKELNSEPTQLLYDSITDHSRNDIVAKDAVTQALSNVVIE